MFSQVTEVMRYILAYVASLCQYCCAERGLVYRQALVDVLYECHVVHDLWILALDCVDNAD